MCEFVDYKLCLTKYPELRQILKQKIATLIGVPFKDDKRIVHIYQPLLDKETYSKNLLITLTFLLSIPKKYKKFIIIVDGRNISYSFIKLILNIINSFSPQISHMYVIKTEQLINKARLVIFCRNFKFQVSTIDLDSLYLAMGKECLPKTIGGHYCCSNEEWVDIQISLEEFYCNVDEQLKTINNLSKNMVVEDFRLNKNQIIAFEENYQEIWDKFNNIPMNEIKHLADSLMRRLMPKRGCFLWNNVDFSEAYQTVKRQVLVLFDRFEAVERLYSVSRDKLSQFKDIVDFEDEYNHIIDNLENVNFLSEKPFFGESLETTKALVEGQSLIRRESLKLYERVKSAIKEGRRLFAAGCYTANVVYGHCIELREKWKRYSALLDSRTELLSHSLEFHQLYEDFCGHAKEWLRKWVPKVKKLTCYDDFMALKKEYEIVVAIYNNTCQGEINTKKFVQSLGDDVFIIADMDSLRLLMNCTSDAAVLNESVDCIWQQVGNFGGFLSNVEAFYHNAHTIKEWSIKSGLHFLQNINLVGRSLEQSKDTLSKVMEFEKVSQNVISGCERLLTEAEEFSKLPFSDKIDCVAGELKTEISNYTVSLEICYKIVDSCVEFYSYLNQFNDNLELTENELSHYSNCPPTNVICQSLSVIPKLWKKLSNSNNNVNDEAQRLQLLLNAWNKVRTEVRTDDALFIAEQVVTTNRQYHSISDKLEEYNQIMTIFLEYRKLETNYNDISAFYGFCSKQLAGLPKDTNIENARKCSEEYSNIEKTADVRFVEYIKLHKLTIERMVQWDMSNLVESMTLMMGNVNEWRQQTDMLLNRRKKVVSSYLGHCNVKMNYDKVVKLIKANEILMNSVIQSPTCAEEAESMNLELMYLKESMEGTYEAAVIMFEQAESLLMGDHYDKVGVRELVDLVETAWMRLRNNFDYRMRLTTAGLDYFTTVRQVCEALGGLKNDYSVEGTDWCSEYKSDILPRIDELVTTHNKRKQDFMKACTLVRKAADIFIKYIVRLEEDITYVNVALEEVMELEKSVLVLWANRRDEYSHCRHYCELQQCGKEILNYITRGGDHNCIRELENTFYHLTEAAMEGSLHQNSVKSWVSAIQKRVKELNWDYSDRTITCAVNYSKDKHVVTELVTTEQAYVNDLSDCIKYYLTPLKSSLLNPPEVVSRNIPLIFGNIEDLRNFHKGIFLPDLMTFESEGCSIGRCFVTWSETFSLYVKYCVNKHEVDRLVDDECWEYFHRMQVDYKLDESLDSYLVKPVQRITKYRLLLANLIENATFCNELKEAYNIMCNVPENANNAIHVHYLSGLPEGRSFYGDILHQQRLHIKKSSVKSLSKDKERLVVLFESFVVFGKILQVKGYPSYSYIHQIPLSDVNLRDIDGDLFVIGGYCREIVVKTPSNEDKITWLTKLSLALERLPYRGRKSLLPFM